MVFYEFGSYFSSIYARHADQNDIRLVFDVLLFKENGVFVGDLELDIILPTDMISMLNGYIVDSSL